MGSRSVLMGSGAQGDCLLVEIWFSDFIFGEKRERERCDKAVSEMLRRRQGVINRRTK